MLTDLEARMLAALKEVVAKADKAHRVEIIVNTGHDYQDGPHPEWIDKEQAKGLDHIRALIAEADERVAEGV